ncbi:MAG: fibrillarin-like rRNA/tRNA 2'-O-methyltransferase [Candidatus Altiarchaeales archaeon]|nr:fibrillarin-like rRNA/tRNA 2'-O-methyltransferase [Candidatus Altiarchaeales archaeon]
MVKQVFPGVYRFGRDFATKSQDSKRVYGERLKRTKGGVFRVWDPHRSKVAAALVKGLNEFPVKADSNVLYLGASSGTTASHIADVTGGLVYCVEFAKRSMRDLYQVSLRKRNMVPVLADARHPWEYNHLVSCCDVLIQDVAQPRQAEIVLVNSNYFDFREALLSIKSRSIDTTRTPKKIFDEEVAKLEKIFSVKQKLLLKPFEEDHILVHLVRK